MREIKFRGKRKDNGELVYGLLIRLFALGKEWHQYWGIQDEDSKEYEVIPETVGQFTGLHDKNGKEIYEGDIIRWDKTGYSAPVSYERGWYVLNGEPIMCYVDDSDQEDDYFDTSKDCRNSEIIGNIHENPDLLKEDKE